MFHKCVFGPVHLTRCILPHMMERNSGMIAVVNCVEAVLAAPFMSTIAGYKQVKRYIKQCTNKYSNIFEYFPPNIDIRIRFVANFKAEYYLNIFVRIFPNIGL